MNYLTSAEAAEKWNISRRRVNTLLESGRIVGAEMKGNMWLIPDTAEKPSDNRIHNGRKKKEL